MPPSASSGRVKLSVLGVRKTFKLDGRTSIDAVKDVSFDVMENEVCALLGPSGCGKSTVLRMVAGLEEPTEGQMTLDGRPIDAPEKSRGMVFQAYTSFDWLTVARNIEYGMRINGLPPAERAERVTRFLKLVRLEKFRDAYPCQLSGGMRQRVAIARTLANDPSILLMDEPFGALDAETRWQMQELTVNIVESSGTTVLLVTHDIDEAIYLADRIVFMSRHPGTVRENIVPGFKQGRRFANREEMMGVAGYFDLHRHITRLMREAHAEEDA